MNMNINKEGEDTQFGKGQNPSEIGKKGGRPKSFKKYLKDQFNLELGISFDKETIFEVIESLLFESSKVLRQIESNDDLPATLSSIAGAILKDRKAGRISTIESIWDRVYGKSIERIESKVEETSATKEQLREEIKKLMGQLGEAGTIKE